MENEIRQSILQTVLYGDIFDYPLTSPQIWKYLISSKRFRRDNFDNVIRNINEPIFLKNGFYFIKGKEDSIIKRIKRKKESGKKLVLIYRIAAILSFIPSALLIGVSGGLSMDNAGRNDDIDIFVITKRNSIWITRLLIIMVLKILRKHRSRTDTKVANKICLNMMMDEGHLYFGIKKQNLYTAHEIVQMVPIFDRNKTHAKFIMQNLWVKKFLPNAFSGIKNSELRIKNKKKLFIIHYSLFMIEFIVKEIQLWYIKKHKTVESVSSGWLAFHPLDYNEEVMNYYKGRLKKYGEKI